MTNNLDIFPITLEEITFDILQQANNKVLKFRLEEVDFYIKLNLKKQSDKLVVFSNGAIDRSKKNPPVFMRGSWHEEVNANCIFVDDPTVHKAKLTVGWGIGTENHYYLESISNIIKNISSHLKIPSSNILYYGSSAGGTMSIMLATMHKMSRALVNNPQAFTYKYLDGKVIEKICISHFPNKNISNLIEDFHERLSILECFKKHEYIPKLLYILNGYSITDYERQYIPLQKEIQEQNIDISNIEFLIYNNKKLKHGPLPKERTLHIINSLID